jgi:hypothetical protein
MRLAQTQRLLATAVLLLAGTAITWWLVGYPIGKGILDSPGGLASFRRTYGFQESSVVWLFALALVVPVTRAVLASASPQARWLALLGVAVVAVLLLQEWDSTAGRLGVALFVLAVAAVAESDGTARIVVAIVAGAVVTFAFTVDSPFSLGELAAVVLLRAVFFFCPLLVGPHYVDAYVLEAAQPKAAQGKGG